MVASSIDNARATVCVVIARLQRLRVEQADEAVGDGLCLRGARRHHTGEKEKGQEREERRGPDDASHGGGDGLHEAPPNA
jgi:hypothetical protein